MPSVDLCELTGTEITQGAAAGAFTIEEVVQALLNRIAEHDPLIQAWETVDPEWALAQARRVDSLSERGPLHGVPIGVKDVIDTAALPTQMGSPLYAGHQPRTDAACVAQTRAAGAVVIGKTVTAEFAGTQPTRTRNPRNTAHTPGGSSSGSAAAVAAGMVPMAYGTQTGGSVLRPAAFCGVVGFKPTFGSYNPVGVKPAAESLDTLGLIARSIDDIELFHNVLSGAPPILESTRPTAPRIGVCRTHLWDTAQTETIDAIEDAAQRLATAGAKVVPIELLDGFQQLTAKRQIINAYERARGLAHEWFEQRDGISAKMAHTCEIGFEISQQEYRAVLIIVEHARQQASQMFDDLDVLLTPTAPGEAPHGHDYAGDPRFQELWTLLHMPAITLPTHSGPNDLPVGIQLVARRYADAKLLAVAHWTIEQLFSA